MAAQSSFEIRPFRIADQAECKQLILSGLAEHFGRLNPNYNSDLDDIFSSYIENDHFFFVAEEFGKIIGTGALKIESNKEARIVRLSVRRDKRRRGLAMNVVKRLVETGMDLGIDIINVETNLDWVAAIRVYERYGFRFVNQDSESLHFLLELGNQPL